MYIVYRYMHALLGLFTFILKYLLLIGISFRDIKFKTIETWVTLICSDSFPNDECFYYCDNRTQSWKTRMTITVMLWINMEPMMLQLSWSLDVSRKWLICLSVHITLFNSVRSWRFRLITQVQCDLCIHAASVITCTCMYRHRRLCLNWWTLLLISSSNSD